MDPLLTVMASFRTSPTPFVVMLGIGFAVGVFGHLYGSRFIVGIGVAIIFLATLFIPLALSVYR